MAPHTRVSWSTRLYGAIVVVAIGWFVMAPVGAAGAEAPEAKAETSAGQTVEPSWAELVLREGGVVGLLIIVLSIIALALVLDHLITIRRGRLMPPRLAEQVDSLLASRRYGQARDVCYSSQSFLARVLGAGLEDVDLGPAAMERAMEEAAQERAAHLMRRIEYLSLIGNIAPMLGLLGTVIGMIAAFKAVAHVEGPDKAPALAAGIYHALITTCMGLIVAIPALGAHSIFRNRADQLAAETSLLAEHICRPLLRAPKGAAVAGVKPATAARPPAKQTAEAPRRTPDSGGRDQT